MSKAVSHDLNDAQRGMTFMTRSKGTAKNYAKQQAGIEREPGISALVKKHMPEKFNKAYNEVPALDRARLISNLPSRNRQVFEARIPRGQLKSMETAPVEPGRIRASLNDARFDKVPAPVKDLASAVPFQNNIAIRGGVAPKHIVGNPQYQKTTLPEVKQHFQDAMADPKGLVKDIGRAYTGISHRPSNIIGNVPKPPQTESAFLEGVLNNRPKVRQPQIFQSALAPKQVYKTGRKATGKKAIRRKAGAQVV